MYKIGITFINKIQTDLYQPMADVYHDRSSLSNSPLLRHRTANGHTLAFPWSHKHGCCAVYKL